MAQGGGFLNELDMAVEERGAGNVADQIADVLRAAYAFQRVAAFEFRADLQLFELQAAIEEVFKYLKEDAMGFAVKLLFPQLHQGISGGVGVEEHRAENGAFRV